MRRVTIIWLEFKESKFLRTLLNLDKIQLSVKTRNLMNNVSLINILTIFRENATVYLSQSEHTNIRR